MATKAVDPWAVEWLGREQARLCEAVDRIKAARIAAASVHFISLALAHIELYEGAKGALRALDFGDLIAAHPRAADRPRRRRLGALQAGRRARPRAAGRGAGHRPRPVGHPARPDRRVLRRRRARGGRAGAPCSRWATRSSRSISFQGAAPERFAAETRRVRAPWCEAAGRAVRRRCRCWKAGARRREVLDFVDAVFADPEAAAGLRPAAPRRPPGAPPSPRRGRPRLRRPLAAGRERAVGRGRSLGAGRRRAAESANKKLARRIAAPDQGHGGSAARRCSTARPGVAPAPRYGDVLILVRRRNALFHEIIRALKRRACRWAAPTG